jgi:hypothetical protein
VDSEVRCIHACFQSCLCITGFSHGGVWGGLQGFPRADIDVYEARVKRHRLACIDTDHKEIMTKIEKVLFSLHTLAKAAKGEQAPMQQEAPDQVRVASSLPRTSFTSHTLGLCLVGC